MQSPNFFTELLQLNPIYIYYRKNPDEGERSRLQRQSGDWIHLLAVGQTSCNELTSQSQPHFYNGTYKRHQPQGSLLSPTTYTFMSNMQITKKTGKMFDVEKRTSGTRGRWDTAEALLKLKNSLSISTCRSIRSALHGYHSWDHTVREGARTVTATADSHLSELLHPFKRTLPNLQQLPSHTGKNPYWIKVQNWLL